MKYSGFTLRTAFAFLLSTSVLTSCGDDAPEGDSATVQEEQTVSSAEGLQYTVDTSASRVRFVGHGVGKNHPGNFRLSSGSVAVSGNQITGGSFVINIKSMDMEEEGEKIDGKLLPHLQSGDFFEADKFGTAKFEITGVTPYERTDADTSIVDGANFRVSGNFTLKDVTKNVSFPARVDLDDNTLKAKANFDIDRTQWNMNYRSEKSLGDKFISEKVNIELDVQAKR
jgi:polyisoprenoid-binding protein YceI